MKAPDIGLEKKAVKKIAALLETALADLVVLQAKTRNYHWNVRGMAFSALHEFFGTQYGLLDEAIDDTAERIRQLGLEAPGQLALFLQSSSLKETTGNLKAEEMLQNLLADHEFRIRDLRKAVDACTELGDAGNADFLTAQLESHEKMAWMIRAHLN